MMSAREVLVFMGGATTLGCWVIALFFFKYWSKTRDRLFLCFAAAFLIFSLNWLALAVASPSQESRHWIFVVRIVGFALILLGILDKNRPGTQDP
jgi:hypothetical protein